MLSSDKQQDFELPRVDRSAWLSYYHVLAKLARNAAPGFEGTKGQRRARATCTIEVYIVISLCDIVTDTTLYAIGKSPTKRN